MPTAVKENRPTALSEVEGFIPSAAEGPAPRRQTKSPRIRTNGTVLRTAAPGPRPPFPPPSSLLPYAYRKNSASRECHNHDTTPQKLNLKNKPIRQCHFNGSVAKRGSLLKRHVPWVP